MNPTHRTFIWVLTILLLPYCGPEKKGPQKLDRAILGDELKFGRDAARFELWNEAIFRWEKVIDQDPNNSNAINNLAVAYETIGDFDRAAALYKKALELNEDSPQIRKNYKRFQSFYKKHQRQRQRERRAAEEARQADNNDGGGGFL